jgi:lysophospholipase L1-like esterase
MLTQTYTLVMRKVVRLLLFVGFVVVVVVAGLEAALRGFDIPPRSNQVPHPVLNHTWRPNTTFVHREFADRGVPAYEHTYNAQAWLEARAIQQDKPPRTFRIFYLGDSYTECTCPMEQSVPRRVESALRPYFLQKNLAVEVVNTGTSSYAPSLYYLVLKEILPYQPDLVVIDVDLTDVFDDWIYRSTARFDASGDLLAVAPKGPIANRFVRTAQGLHELTPVERALNSARDHSNLASVLFALKTAEPNPVPATAAPDPFAWCRPLWDGALRADVEYSEDMLRRIVALAGKHHVKLAFTVVPHLEQFQGRCSLLPNEAIRELASETATPYLDSWAALNAQLGDQDAANWYIPGDMHFNLAGYHAWAEAHIGFLLDPRNALLP